MTPESFPLDWRGLAWVKYHDEHASSARPWPFVRSAAWRAPIDVGGAAWTIYLYFDDFTHGPWWCLEVEDHDDTLVFASERCLPDPDAAWDSLNETCRSTEIAAVQTLRALRAPADPPN